MGNHLTLRVLLTVGSTKGPRVVLLRPGSWNTNFKPNFLSMTKVQCNSVSLNYACQLYGPYRWFSKCCSPKTRFLKYYTLNGVKPSYTYGSMPLIDGLFTLTPQSHYIILILRKTHKAH